MFAGLKRAARAIFVDDIRLQRDGGRLRVVLDPAADAAARRESPLQRSHRQADERRMAQLQLIRGQLAELFASHPALARGDLGTVDAALAEHGLALLDIVALPVLRRALQQFEAAVLDWSPEGLAYLRSRLAVAVRERERREGGAADPAADAGDTSALPVVREVAVAPDAAPVDEDHAALLAAYGSAAGAAGGAGEPGR